MDINSFCVLKSGTCSRATKRQADLDNAQQETNKVNVVSRLTLASHLCITGATVHLSCQGDMLRLSSTTKLWGANTTVGAQSVLAGRKASLKTLLLALK